MKAVLLLLRLAVGCAASSSSSEATEIRTATEFERAVSASPRAVLVEFYSEACGFCAEFAPTWRRLTATATRLEAARVNVDVATGLEVASGLGVLDKGIPAVVVFTRHDGALARSGYDTLMAGDHDGAQSGYDTLMAGDLYPLSRLLKLTHRATRGLALDDHGFFLKKGSSRR